MYLSIVISMISSNSIEKLLKSELNVTGGMKYIPLYPP